MPFRWNHKTMGNMKMETKCLIKISISILNL